jgi:hypothetical protein
MAVRTGQAAERAGQPPVEAIVAYLGDVLGERLTAVIAGVDDAELLHQWIRGEGYPPAEAERSLRDAYEIVRMLLEHESPGTVRAWFRGVNPFLSDEAPALVISKDPRRVMGAANAFLAGSFS